MEEALKIIFRMIDRFLAGNYDPLEFSYDLPWELVQQLGKVFPVNKELAQRMNDELPTVCDMYEYGDDPEPFKAKMKEAYDYVKEAL